MLAHRCKLCVLLLTLLLALLQPAVAAPFKVRVCLLVGHLSADDTADVTEIVVQQGAHVRVFTLVKGLHRFLAAYLQV